MLFDFRLHVALSGGLFRRLIVIRKRQRFSSIASRADDPPPWGHGASAGALPCISVDEMQSKYDQRTRIFNRRRVDAWSGCSIPIASSLEPIAKVLGRQPVFGRLLVQEPSYVFDLSARAMTHKPPIAGRDPFSFEDHLGVLHAPTILSVWRNPTMETSPQSKL
jgi:hypothetical protein